MAERVFLPPDLEVEALVDLDMAKQRMDAISESFDETRSNRITGKKRSLPRKRSRSFRCCVDMRMGRGLNCSYCACGIEF